MKFSADEIIAKLLSLMSNESLDYDNLGHNYNVESVLKGNFGNFEYMLHAERSSDDDHDIVETVIYFKDHDVHISMKGSYNSYNCSEFWSSERMKEVKPVEKTIFIYE